MTCLFCGRSLGGDDVCPSGVVTCMSCDKVAIATERLRADNYVGQYGAWLRMVDRRVVDDATATDAIFLRMMAL